MEEEEAVVEVDLAMARTAFIASPEAKPGAVMAVMAAEG